MIYQGINELIGLTPLIELNRYCAKHELAARIVAKVEAFNPTGSVKDRAAVGMLLDAELRGVIAAGATIIEPTSGNTGVGLAMLCAVKGYRMILTMPETMSVERRLLASAYGAEIVLTEGSKGMRGAIERAEQLQSEIPNSFIPSQFTNPANPAYHKATTGVEIYEDTDGAVDVFVAGVGSGGTVSGTGAYLKMAKPEAEVVAVEPASSPILSGGVAGAHKIQGIGANFVPQNYDPKVVDRVVTVTNEDAYAAAAELAKTEGIFAGISSGAALSAAVSLAKQPKYAGKLIVVLLPDSGDRYLSTGVFG